MSNTHPTVEVLAPENTLPAVQVDHTPDAVMSQWKRANAGLLEIVRFGAMLVEVDRSLERQNTVNKKGQITGREGGLKAWLEQNCPEINYKSAMGYKVVAEQMRDKFKIPAKLPLTLALPRSDGTIEAFVPDTVKIDKRKVEKYQREFYGMCEGKSMYQLTLDLGLREPKPKGGAYNKPKNLSAEEKHAKQIDAAREVFRRDLDSLLNHVRRSHHLLLGETQLDIAIHKAEVLLARLKEAKGADKNRQKEE